MKFKFIFIIIGLLLLVSSVSAVEPIWTSANGCWTNISGSYTIVKWNTTGISSWTPPSGVTSVDYLVIAGGGGGGVPQDGGGGGAGGLRTSYTTNTGKSGGGADLESQLTGLSGVQTIVVGNGGSGSSGSNSSFGTIISIGGGVGGYFTGLDPGAAGGNGGSGGGGGYPNGAGGSRTTSPIQGYDGAVGAALGGSSGGGGAGSIGSGATGGDCISSSITGDIVWYAGGGGAGGNFEEGAGAGGCSIAGHGGDGFGANTGITSGVNGTGSGGGGNGWGFNSVYATGGSGVVIIKYLNAIPSAAFTTNPSSGTIPLNVTFTDISANGPTSWNWSFGDGIYNETKNPVHTYSIAGSYTVILNVSGVYGYSNFSSNITALPSTPIASFTINPNVGTNPLDVTFTDTSSGSITGWSWSFGDGGSSTLQNPIHTYSNLGTYYPILSVTSSVGDNISAQSTPVYVIISAVPLVDFTGVPTTGTAPLSVQFTDHSVALNGITGWNWSFGEGNYSNLQNPVHIYPNTGQYSITLVATSSDSFSNYTSKVGYVNVGVPSSTISASFIANQTNVPTYPAAIQFTDTSVCNPFCTQWAWDLNNDGSTDSVSQNPLYIYNYPGSYSPKLITSNGINSGTKVMNLYITIGPVFVKPTITQPTEKWVPGYRDNTTGSIYSFRGDTSIDLANSTYLKYWLQNFTATGNFSIYGFAIALTAPIMHVFGFWIYLIIWGLYLFAVWIRSQDVTLPLIIGIISMGTFGLLFPKESLPVIIVMFVVCGAIIITKLMKDSI